MQKPTVTIGIPAYNEEANIKNLLNSLLKQQIKSFKLLKIIVASDGSEDQTAKIAKGLKSTLIKVIDGRKRLGKVVRENNFFENTKSNILIILDADTVPIDTRFLEKIIKPIIKRQADLVSVPRIAQLPTTFTEKVIYKSSLLKRKLFENYLKKGQNIYTCNGAARAFSKRLFKSLRFPFTFGEDAFSYLYCQSYGFGYHFEKSTAVIYKLPDNIGDHKKQSVRFFKSQNSMGKYFDKEFVRNEYRIPAGVILRAFLEMFTKSPLETLLYSMVLLYMKIDSILSGQTSPLWDISKSSKKNFIKNTGIDLRLK